jgi:hypothetical protein
MDNEISDAVKILCDRMENNPEDFLETEFNPSTLHRGLGKYYYEGKTIEALAKGEPAGAEALWFLNETERTMLVHAYRNMMRHSHTTHIVGKLLDKPEPELGHQEKRAKPLTTAQIQTQTLRDLNASFDKSYAKNHETDSLVYKATGRYNLDHRG